MKKIISAVMAAAMLGTGLYALPASAADTVSVIVDNEAVSFDQQPVIIDGSTLVPIRAVFEKAGASVSWDQETQTATLIRGNYTVTIKLNDSVLYKNGTQVALSVPAAIINDRVLIPVRAIGEAMDFNIAWDGYHYRVVVGTDGKEYRPYTARSVAFADQKEIADFYSDQTFAWKDMDVDGDGSQDTVAFTRTLDTADEKSPLLIINGTDFTSQLNFMHSTYSFAVTDINNEDGKKDIIITENGDSLTAYFFRYDGTNLTQVKDETGNNASAKYVSHLFLDNKGYMLSDLDGVCFTDIMLTGCTYAYTEGVIKKMRVSNAGAMLPRKLVHTYNDNMVYKYYVTDTFEAGIYKDKQTDKTITAAELNEFTLNNMNVDKYDPSYIEMFITMPDGTNMVIVPYSS